MPNDDGNPKAEAQKRNAWDKWEKREAMQRVLKAW
jgi:hypothetical protein